MYYGTKQQRTPTFSKMNTNKLARSCLNNTAVGSGATLSSTMFFTKSSGILRRRTMSASMNASMNANASALREYSKACSPSRVVVDRHRHWSTVSASVSHQNLLAPVGRCQQHQRRRLLSSSSKTNKTEPHANSDSNTAKINERGGTRSTSPPGPRSRSARMRSGRRRRRGW